MDAVARNVQTTNQKPVQTYERAERRTGMKIITGIALFLIGALVGAVVMMFMIASWWGD